jgi:ubiquinone/menaquinone biosynthesis C-methylase UbiE
MDCKEVIANYWNFRASTYTNGINSFDEEERTVWKKALEDAVPFNKRLKILDVGTGTGFLALLFAEMGHEVTAIDLSDGMLERAKHNAQKMRLDINFSHGDAENLPFESSIFDMVVNKYLLWTLPHPSAAVLEWKRVLRPGGRVFSIDGNWFDSRPDRCVKRFIVEWSARFMEKNKRYLIFKDHCYPIKSSLPLYNGITPANISCIFSEMGFVNTTINPLLEVQRLQKNRYSLVRRLLDNTLIFSISAEKGEM